MDLPWLGVSDLVADLARPDLAVKLLAGDGLDRILTFATQCPTDAIAALAKLPLFPDGEGNRRALRGPELENEDAAEDAEAALWLPAQGLLGTWVDSLQGGHPPLVSRELDQRHGALPTIGLRMLSQPFPIRFRDRFHRPGPRRTIDWRVAECEVQIMVGTERWHGAPSAFLFLFAFRAL